MAVGQERRPRREAVVLPVPVPALAEARFRPLREAALLLEVLQVLALRAPPLMRLPPSAPRPARPFPR